MSSYNQSLELDTPERMEWKRTAIPIVVVAQRKKEKKKKNLVRKTSEEIHNNCV